MLDGIDLADIHGQFKFNFEHAAISRDDSKRLLDWAFRFDLERNGPSLFRICETIFQGWKRYHDHPDLRVRQRIANETVKAAHHLRRCALGHGEALEANKRLRSREDS